MGKDGHGKGLKDLIFLLLGICLTKLMLLRGIVEATVKLCSPEVIGRDILSFVLFR